MTISTWNPADKTAGTTLTNGNLTATGTSGNNGARSTSHKTNASGKFYFEISNINFGGSGAGFIGLQTLAQGLGASGDFGLSQNGSILSEGSNFGNPGWGAPDTHIACFAVDTTAKKFWVNYNNGLWDDTTDNPATGTGGHTYATTSDLYIACWLQNGPCSADIHTDSTNQSFSPPSGFTPWDGAATPVATSQPQVIIAQ